MAQRNSILIVGVGSIGERHLRCFQSTGRVNVSLCEINPLLRKTVTDRYSVARSLVDFNSALEAQPDAVVICTPAHLHIPMAMEAAQRGIHLLIEKPLSTTLNGIDTLRDEVAKRKVVAAVAYVYRAHPALSAMRDAISRGRFGEMVEVVATSGQHFPFYRPAYRETYYKSRVTGGGAVQDALTHVINAAEWIVGPVTELVADAAHQLLEGVEVEDTVHVIGRHKRILSSFSLNQHQAPNESSLTCIGTKGTARFEMHNSRWRWQTDPGDAWHDETAQKLERDTLFTLQAESFLAAIDGPLRESTPPTGLLEAGSPDATKPLCSLDDGLQTLRVNLNILKSIEERCWKRI